MIKITKEDLQKFEKALDLKQKTTQETYVYIINKFLKKYKTNISLENIYEFLNSYSPNSRIAVYYCLKFFFKSIGYDINIKYSEIAPKGVIRTREVLSKDEIEKLIQYSKKEGNPISGIFCLSTTYGMRRTEMINLKPEDIDTESQRIYIKPLKTEEITERHSHFIPDQVKNILEDYKNFASEINKIKNPQILNTLFDRVAHNAGITLRPRLGFHSIRRALVTELRALGHSKDNVELFMRWKPMIKSMVDVYDITDKVEVDKKIFLNHPFINMWL